MRGLDVCVLIPPRAPHRDAAEHEDADEGEHLEAVGSAVPGGGCTTAVTMIVDVPVFVSLKAVIVALPAALAVTSPDAETVLMAGLLELQAISLPVNVLLLASRVTAESCAVAPI